MEGALQNHAPDRQVSGRSSFLRTAFLTGLVLFGALVCCAARQPVRKAARAKPVTASVKSAAPTSAHIRDPYVGAISVDADTGKVLFANNEHAEAYPASVTKLMTLCLVLEDVRAGKYALATEVTITADVNYSEPSAMGLVAGQITRVSDLAMALMVESANDAAIALAVHANGSIANFVARMNARAAELGMAHTRYYNPNGLPPNAARHYPWKSFNATTAYDQMLLARHLLRLPDTRSFTSIKTCDLIKTARGFRVNATRRTNQPFTPSVLAEGEKLVKQLNNHNKIMRTDKLKIVNSDGREAIDGLKTGFISAGGSSISLSGTRGKHHAIVVVLGSVNSKTRDQVALGLMHDALGALAW